jgi:ribonuclease Z
MAQTEAMVTLVMLGTGTPNPDPRRAGSAVAVIDDDRWMLIDCGRAATHRVLEAGLDLSGLDAVFVTHHHSDHVSDLATLATTRWVAGAATPLTVVAPDGPAARYAERCLDAYDDQAFHSQARASAGPRPVISTQSFDASSTVTIVYSSGPWAVGAALVDHHPVAPAVGYLVRHDERRVAISGDTAVCDGMRDLANGADVLVHEALLADAVHPALLEWNASATAVGELARTAGVGRLVLTHAIPAPSSDADRQRYIDDVRSGGYTGAVLVASDLDRIDLSGARNVKEM